MIELDTVISTFTPASSIQSSSGAYFTIVPSLSRAVFKAQCFDTSGLFIGVYTGPAGQEDLAFIVGPGSNESTDTVLPTGSRVSIRSMDSSTSSVGNVAINFLG